MNIVDTGDSGYSMLDFTPEHLSWMRQGRGRRARGNLDQLLEPVLPVEAGDPEFLNLQGGKVESSTASDTLTGVAQWENARK